MTTKKITEKSITFQKLEKYSFGFKKIQCMSKQMKIRAKLKMMMQQANPSDFRSQSLLNSEFDGSTLTQLQKMWYTEININAGRRQKQAKRILCSAQALLIIILTQSLSNIVQSFVSRSAQKNSLLFFVLSLMSGMSKQKRFSLCFTPFSSNIFLLITLLFSQIEHSYHARL